MILHLILSLLLTFTQDERLTPVTLQIQDSATGDAIKDFTYKLRFESPLGKEVIITEKWTEHHSENGTLEFHAPASCEVFLQITSKYYIGGYGHSHYSLELKTDNKERKLVVKLKRGISVSGTVISKSSKKPIQGIRISPVIFTPPQWSADHSRSVKSDSSGMFMVHGVEPLLGVQFEHVEYQTSREGLRDLANLQDETHTKDIKNKEIQLELLPVIEGVVKSPDGKAIGNVLVSDRNGHSTKTRTDGTFALPTEGRATLEFTKEGYKEITFDAASNMKVTLSALLEVKGRVLDPSGKPIKNYTVIAGPGDNPDQYYTSSITSDQESDQFVLRVKDKGSHWIGAKSPGYAVWEGQVIVGDSTPELTIVLAPGHKLQGKVNIPNSTKQILQAKLAPFRAEPEMRISGESASRQLGSQMVTISDSNTFLFEHLRSDDYILQISGPGVTSTKRYIHVAADRTDLGEIRLNRSGKVVGQAFNPHNEKPLEWSFVSGEVVEYDAVTMRGSEWKPISFKADEKGRFSVDNVPAGLVRVTLRYMATACIVEGYSILVRVEPGETSEVRFFDPVVKNEVKLDFKLGDGSRTHFQSGIGDIGKKRTDNVNDRDPMIQLTLTPLGKGYASKSEWVGLPRNGEITLRDVIPGKYRLHVDDWQGSVFVYDSIADQTIVVPSNDRHVTVRLGAGSVHGRIDYGGRENFITVIYAASEDGKLCRRGYCDRDGNWCLRYLIPGKYRLKAHDPKGGWAELGEVEVNNDSQNVGAKHLKDGGSLLVKMRFSNGDMFPDRIEAVDPHGFVISWFDNWKTLGQTMEFQNLWSSDWTIRAMRDEKVLAQRRVGLANRDKRTIELVLP